MQSIRCDACGMKALLAASQCPHCGHLFDLRDSFGELLPLAQCPTCESYYPLARGECRWCGTKPAPNRIAPYAWKGAGVLGFIALALGATLAHRSMSAPGAPQTAAESPTLATSPSAVDSSMIARPPALADTFDAAQSTGAASPDTTTFYLPVPELPSRDTAESSARTREAAVMPRERAAVPPRERAAVRPRERAAVPPRERGGPKSTGRARKGGQWVRAVARTWIPVRSAASRDSRILASIGPDTRVQLGEAQGDFVRIRTHGLSGWVERSAFPRTREVVSRR